MNTYITYELYDSSKVSAMGEELGYMGTFNSVSEALDYAEEYNHFFEGLAEIYVRETEDELS